MLRLLQATRDSCIVRTIVSVLMNSSENRKASIFKQMNIVDAMQNMMPVDSCAAAADKISSTESAAAKLFINKRAHKNRKFLQLVILAPL